MQELTEREKKLLDIIKMLVNVNTIDAIYNKHVADMTKWKYDTLGSAGLTLEWQDNMMETLEKEFGMAFKKVDKNLEETKDGNQN